jgi:hypothetical protein
MRIRAAPFPRGDRGPRLRAETRIGENGAMRTLALLTTLALAWAA